MPYDANKYEQEILAFWEKDKTFEKSVSERPENKPYVFYDGPPFATGLPHYGHILSSVIKDVVPRYWTMKGYRVRRRWGWDCHGLPIESLIEKELKISGKKDIEEKIGVKAFNDACRAKVLTYTKEWKKMVERIGRWVEFDNSYKTMDTTYMESVWWALKTIWDKGLIYEGRKVLMYCTRCETPVSKAEVAMDNSYKEVTEESAVVKFRIKEQGLRIKEFFEQVQGDYYLLAWTTTPWTLPGNVALAVGNNIEYSFVKSGDEVYVLAKDLVATHFEGKLFEEVRSVKGADLIGLEYEPLFDMPAMLAIGKKVYYVATADFVTTEEGTGIVHTAVIYGEDDYNLGLKIDLPMVPMLDDAGHYNDAAPALVKGLFYKKGEKEIKKNLEEKGLLFSLVQHTHSYPHCWRCDTPLIYNAVSSWFVNIQKVKDRMIELNEKVSWFPEHLKHGRFLNIVKDAPDWNISRNRYWATALPFWKSEDGDVLCVGSVEELEKLSGQKVDDLHKDTMDTIVIEKDDKTYHRVPEVLDSWVEAASMPFAEWHYPFENKEIVGQRMPGQYIAEYIAQTRTWFYYMHVMAVLLFDDISFEHVVTTGTILNEKGEKLSKSKQNYTDPWIIIEQYGMDALRYYLMTSVVMQAENVLFNDRDVRDVYNKVVNILWNVLEFYSMFADEKGTTAEAPKATHVLDKWIMARLQQLISEVTEHMDEYDTVHAGRPIKDFLDDLSTWYVRRSRDRFKGDDVNDAQAALATLGHVLQTLSKVMAPFTPFIAEKVWYSVTGSKESVHLQDWPVVLESLQSTDLIEQMHIARKAVEMGLSLRKEAGVRVRQPLSDFAVYGSQFTTNIFEIIADELNVKSARGAQETPQAEEHIIIKEEQGLVVALNTQISDALRREGVMRELIRAINGMRKEQKLTREDTVTVEYATESDELESIIQEFVDELKSGVLASEITRGAGETPVETDLGTLSISIQKI